MMVQAGSGGQNLLDLWDRRRLVAVDVETLMEARRHRVISLGIVTCRQGAERGQHHWLVNPGIPIDPVTQRIHGLRDRDLMGERSFDELMLELMGLFVGVPGERVVLVAHQANFDIPVIRDECDRVGSGMPDLPVLDTAGPVLALLGVKPKSRRLGDLLATLGLHNPSRTRRCTTLSPPLAPPAG
jgi:DNA polymerase III epsilon subunit-like protein